MRDLQLEDIGVDSEHPEVEYARANEIVTHYRKNCILDCDSPSYPPEDDEYRQCGCRSCAKEYEKRKLKDK